MCMYMTYTLHILYIYSTCTTMLCLTMYFNCHLLKPTMEWCKSVCSFRILSVNHTFIIEACSFWSIYEWIIMYHQPHYFFYMKCVISDTYQAMNIQNPNTLLVLKVSWIKCTWGYWEFGCYYHHYKTCQILPKKIGAKITA